MNSRRWLNLICMCSWGRRRFSFRVQEGGGCNFFTDQIFPTPISIKEWVPKWKCFLQYLTCVIEPSYSSPHGFAHGLKYRYPNNSSTTNHDRFKRHIIKLWDGSLMNRRSIKWFDKADSQYPDISCCSSTWFHKKWSLGVQFPFWKYSKSIWNYPYM